MNEGVQCVVLSDKVRHLANIAFFLMHKMTMSALGDALLVLKCIQFKLRVDSNLSRVYRLRLKERIKS